jgi:hypothetical protein
MKHLLELEQKVISLTQGLVGRTVSLPHNGPPQDDQKPDMFCF